MEKTLRAITHPETFSTAEFLKQSNRIPKYAADIRAALPRILENKRVALVASDTVNHTDAFLKTYLIGLGFYPETYLAPFDSIRFELSSESAGTYQFRPDVICIWESHRKITDFPELLADESETREWISRKASEIHSVWEKAHSLAPSAQILHALYETPLERNLGNLDGSYLFSRRSSILLLNLELARSHPTYVKLLDLEYLSSLIGKNEWFDLTGYYLYNQVASLDGQRLVAKQIARILAASWGRPKKCLVLDLDNTLWGGVIGDDGVDGIVLGPGHPAGEAYRDFQRYLHSLRDRGVILAVCSKNNEETAKNVFLKHPHMALKLDDISCFIANWENKADNLKRIAQTLNIGLDSIVFFDDEPAEREVVRRFLPEVEVLDFPRDPTIYVRTLDSSFAFESAQVSKEDTQRTRFYVNDQKRKKSEIEAVDYDSYLRSLTLTASVEHLRTNGISRFTQLINKSNQFNLRTRRYNEAQIEDWLKQPELYQMFQVELRDRFTDFGVIACIVLRREDRSVFIDTWVMSCRALRRGVEDLTLNAIVTCAKGFGARQVVGEYLSTDKNAMVKDLLSTFGFESEDGRWKLNLSSFIPRKHFINVLNPDIFPQP